MHDLGPEIRRAISGNLGEEEFPDKDVEEPMHRVGVTFGSVRIMRDFELQFSYFSFSSFYFIKFYKPWGISLVSYICRNYDFLLKFIL